MKPTLTVTIRGSLRAVQLDALVDTGFEGALLLPMDVARHVGARIAGWGEIQLADASVKKLATVFCEVALPGDTAAVPVQAVITELTDPVLGMDLFSGWRLRIDSDTGDVQLKRKRP